jgi:hypothetical protein
MAVVMAVLPLTLLTNLGRAARERRRLRTAAHTAAAVAAATACGNVPFAAITVTWAWQTASTATELLRLLLVLRLLASLASRRRMSNICSSSPSAMRHAFMGVALLAAAVQAAAREVGHPRLVRASLDKSSQGSSAPCRDKSSCLRCGPTCEPQSSPRSKTRRRGRRRRRKRRSPRWQTFSEVCWVGDRKMR